MMAYDPLFPFHAQPGAPCSNPALVSGVTTPTNVALCPSGLVTVTFTGPAGLAGAVAVMAVLFVTETFVAALELKVTVAPARKFDPESVTEVPPLVEPTDGDA